MELSYQGPASEKEKKKGKRNVKCGFKIGDWEIYIVADFKWKEKKRRRGKNLVKLSVFNFPLKVN